MADDLQQKLGRLIEPSLQALGYELVRVMLQGKSRLVLQIMAEPVEQRLMTIDDCETISRTLSALLDVHDPINAAYVLEVSSPGIDRPLTRFKDFKRFAGFEARLETLLPVENRKRFRGILKPPEGEDVVIEDQGIAYRLPFNLIDKAKLVLTDELIASFTKN